MNTRKEKIDSQIEAIYRLFKQNEKLPDITNHTLVGKTDGSFIQNGLAVKMDGGLFDPDAPQLFGLERYGTEVALGEIKYFVDEFLSKASLKIDSDLNPSSFRSAVLNCLNGAPFGLSTVILTSYEVESDLYDNKYYRVQFDPETRGFIAKLPQRVRIYPFQKRIIGDKLIVLNTSAIGAQTLAQDNPVTSQAERLFVHASDYRDETRFEIKTVFKLQLLDSSKIRIFQVR